MCKHRLIVYTTLSPQVKWVEYLDIAEKKAFSNSGVWLSRCSSAPLFGWFSCLLNCSLSLSLFLCTGFACFLSHDGGCVWSHKGSVAAGGTQDNTGVSQRVSDELLACNCWTIHIDNKILTYLNNQQSCRKRCLAASWSSTDGSETLDAHG